MAWRARRAGRAEVSLQFALHQLLFLYRATCELVSEFLETMRECGELQRAALQLQVELLAN